VKDGIILHFIWSLVIFTENLLRINVYCGELNSSFNKKRFLQGKLSYLRMIASFMIRHIHSFTPDNVVCTL